MSSEDTEVTLPTASEMQEEDVLRAELAQHEDIRFVSYRTASKLRTLQKQTYLHHIDIFNMIEAFRENGLHGLDPSAKLTETRVQRVISTLYDNLQKRLPLPLSAGSATGGAANSSSSSSSVLPNSNQLQTILQTKANLLQSFLWKTLSPNSDRMKIRTLKTALATLCTGKLMDKLRYSFCQMADKQGQLIHSRFQIFLKDVMKIPNALGEYTSFTEANATGEAETMFEEDQKVTLNDFLEVLISDPGPQCLSWLLVLHRLINSESTFHPVTCGNCLAQGFHGLRYKSDRSNYHLCQNCFWRGNISAPHTDDVFKEYNSFKSHSGKSSFKKSLHCIPGDKKASKSHAQHFPEQPENPIDLSNLVPSTPSNMAHQRGRKHAESDPQFYAYGASTASSDEHSLIAHYASQLATQQQDVGAASSGVRGVSPGRHALKHSRQIVHDLEKRNREIMRDISQLRRYRDMDLQRYECDNPVLVKELNHLRSHKDELDDRLSELQNTRKELMTELEELMKILRS